MAFTAQELDNIFNSALDFYMDKGKSWTQEIQNKPLLQALDSAAGTFPGGKENVSLAVRSGKGGGSLSGYTHDDQVSYYNPANTKRVNYAWREHHIGIGVTLTELKKDGLSVVDSTDGASTSAHSNRDMTALVNIFETKLDEMAEDYNVSLNDLLWGDGTSDAKALAGIQSLILEGPDSGSTGGLSRVTNSWWRNRAITTASGTGPITSSATGGGALLQELQKEYRQLRRYGSPTHKWFAGSDFIDAIETELRANGNYTDQGFMRRQATDGGMAEVSFKGQRIMYDPTLDDLSMSKYCYVLDTKAIKLMYMQGEKKKRHTPARPYDRYVLYRAITTTGVMTARQLNTSGVYEIA